MSEEEETGIETEKEVAEGIGTEEEEEGEEDGEEEEGGVVSIAEVDKVAIFRHAEGDRFGSINLWTAKD